MSRKIKFLFWELEKCHIIYLILYNLWKMTEKIIWKFKQYPTYAFLIPDDRDYYGWDFYIRKNAFGWAKDWDKVEWEVIKNTKGKKPEVKIVKIIIGDGKKSRTDKTIEWIYSWWEWNFGFIDIEWQENWYFVYWGKRNWAIDWGRVKAEIKLYNGKEEAIVLEILPKVDEVIIVWKFRDNEKFWFVLPDDRSSDIFIAWSRKNWAVEWDKVECVIIKRWWKNPEWKIKGIIK